MSAPLQSRSEFAAALNQICTERGIDPQVVIDTIKSAILAAYHKDFQEEFEAFEAAEVELTVDVDAGTGATSIFKNEGGKKVDITPPGFGRIAAQTAKQVILQRVREAEKDAIISEYTDKVGVIISGMVLRFDGKNVIIDIGRGQGYMPPEEQMRGEFYRMNQRLTVYISDIRETMRGKTIIVSRAAEQLVAELFKREVPEVSSGAVVIKAIAREPGVRTKIAVDSTQSGVDPVGSCVGQKGVRVQEVINELNNEKIDIIQYTEDVQSLIAAALAPAENTKIILDTVNRQATVVVPDDQLSLAIGKGGQNVRLAAKLTGYKLDIEGVSGEKVIIEDDANPSIDTLELTDKVKTLLKDAGITTVGDLKAKLDDLKDIKGIGPKAVETITAAVK
jgi:transcription termination/antitermination protein NusA